MSEGNAWGTPAPGSGQTHVLGYSSYITDGVYGMLNDAAKHGGSPRQDMWEKRAWTATGRTVYRSSFWWQL